MCVKEKRVAKNVLCVQKIKGLRLYEYVTQFKHTSFTFYRKQIIFHYLLGMKSEFV